MPLIKLYDYQKEWIQDDSRFLVGLWARQTGKSFASAAKIVLNCRRYPQTAWFAISSGERQVKDFMHKVKAHAKVTGEFLRFYKARYKYKDESGQQDIYQVLSALFDNGSRIIALPANPDTTRGYTGNVYFDEFSTIKNSREMWAAVFPIISRGQFKLMITFTPKGKLNMAYDVWNNKMFTRHKTDIYEAVAQGCPHDIELLKQAIDDPELWAQEYELEFLDEATAFIPYDLIISAQASGAGNKYTSKQSGSFYIGMDIGRRKHLSVIWILEIIGDVYWTREVKVMHKMSFSEQSIHLANAIARYRPVRVCIDQSGMGEKFVEDAKIEHGDFKVEGVLFSAPSKNDMANQTRSLFEDKRIRIPVDKDIRDDIHSVKKTVTIAGNFRFDVEHSEKHHADRFWALALAVHASGRVKPAVSIGSEQIKRELEQDIRKKHPLGDIPIYKPNKKPILGNVSGRFKKRK